MPWQTIVYKRSDLYREVWEQPVRTVAKKYGISDVALAKICRKLAVPLPSRGYWARRAAGQDLPRTPLPALTRGELAEHRSARCVEPAESAPLREDVARLIEAERDPALKLLVPDVLVQAHPLVRMSAPLLRRCKLGDRPVDTNRCLDISVSSGTLDRALRIVDTILKALEARGFEVDVTEPENPDPVPRHSYERKPSRTGVRILGQFVQFRLEERNESFENPPVPPGSHEYRPRYGRRPTGRLALSLGRPYGPGKTCADGKRQRIEDRLGDFVAELIMAAERQRLAAIAAEEQRQREEVRRREAEAAQRQHEAHQTLVKDLEKRIALLRSAQDIGAFADLVAARVTPQSSPAGVPTVADWLAWARARAKRLEARALSKLMERAQSISGQSALTARFGWSDELTTATLLSVVLNPYDAGDEASPAEQ